MIVVLEDGLSVVTVHRFVAGSRTTKKESDPLVVVVVVVVLELWAKPGAVEAISRAAAVACLIMGVLPSFEHGSNVKPGSGFRRAPAHP